MILIYTNYYNFITRLFNKPTNTYNKPPHSHKMNDPYLLAILEPPELLSDLFIDIISFDKGIFPVAILAVLF